MIIKKYYPNLFLTILACLCLVNQGFSQTVKSDSTFHPYYVNYWVTGSICGAGLIGNYLGIPQTLNKKAISLLEIQALDKDNISGIDFWALKQDPSKTDEYLTYSNYVLTLSVAVPLALMLDERIRKDWGDLLLTYMETLTITTNIYEWSFLGPTFQNRLRPITYYEQLTYEQKKSGNNRNSFYSGHVATAAVSTFFFAKVYCDYNPEIGNNRYLLYSAALVPPLILGYCRVKALRHFPSDVMVGIGIGALCGIIIPEFHHFQDKNISLGMFASPEATGIAVKWQPDILK